MMRFATLGVCLCWAVGTFAAGSAIDDPPPSVDECAERITRQILVLRGKRRGGENHEAYLKAYDLARPVDPALEPEKLAPRPLGKGLLFVEEHVEKGEGGEKAARVHDRVGRVKRALLDSRDDDARMGIVLEGKRSIEVFFGRQANTLGLREYRKREGLANRAAMAVGFAALLMGAVSGGLAELSESVSPDSFLRGDLFWWLANGASGLLGLASPRLLEGPNMMADGPENFFAFPAPVRNLRLRIKRYEEWPSGTLSYVGITGEQGSLDLFVEKSMAGDSENTPTLVVIVSPLAREDYGTLLTSPVAVRE